MPLGHDGNKKLVHMEPAAALMQLYLQYLLEISSLDPALVPAKVGELPLENTLESVLGLIFIQPALPLPPVVLPHICALVLFFPCFLFLHGRLRLKY